VQILAPVDGSKLRADQQREVEIQVSHENNLPLEWQLYLTTSDGAMLVLAKGTAAAKGRVAELRANELQPGQSYRLILEARLEQGSTAKASMSILVPEPRYAAIPLESGNLRRAARIYSLDESGQVVAISSDPPSNVVLFIDTRARILIRKHLELGASDVPRLSPDGRRFFFKGTFQDSVEPGGSRGPGLGYYSLTDDTVSTRLAATESPFFSIDRTGRRLVYQGVGTATGPSNPLQYFLYDDETGEHRQLTDDPEAIVFDLDDAACPKIVGTTPVVNAGGTRIVIATRATFGLLEDDPEKGCHIFSYEIAEERLRHIISLNEDLTYSSPHISDDGRWLSFQTSRPRIPTPEDPFSGRFSMPALLDLDTGDLTLPVGGVDDEVSFDSVVTGDGKSVIISTLSDLDPRVGNADRNMELFLYDRESGEFTQISETLGGLVGAFGSCTAPNPSVSRDGGAMIVVGYAGQEEGCILRQGSQRHESTGLYYRFTRLVRKRPGNNSPEWNVQPPAYAAVAAGETLEFHFGATDADGDPITLFAQEKGGVDVPEGSVIEDHRDGTATFTWPTRLRQAGTYELRVAAFDEGGGERVHDVLIDVMPRGEASETPTPTATTTPTLTPTATLTPTVEPPRCVGDCDGDGVVVVTELVAAVGIALRAADMAKCEAADVDGDGAVALAELVTATGHALKGCGFGGLRRGDR
jgi:Tol biopolymer transport system component